MWRLASAALISAALLAQDTRTVTEPSFPPVCAQLDARLEKSGPAGLAAASETMYDTAKVQSAIDLCPAGQAVELQPAGANNAFLIGPIRLARGVTLLVDAGITVFASRNPRAYDATAAKACGTIAASGSGCLPLITANGADGAGIMGYGSIDGRGELPMLVNGASSGTSWWDLANQANTQNLNQNNPRLVQVNNTDGFTMYKITLMNSPFFHVALGTDTNFTAWGVKIITPYDARNTDGIDPGYSSNVTITKSYISDGDDNVAVGGNNSPGAHHISVTDNHFGDGHGASIGSFTLAGVDNVLFDHITIVGNTANTNQNGLRIKSDVSRGGLVQNITYSNICMQNVRHPIVIDPFYTSGATGNLIPQYKNITLQNIHATTEGSVTLEGHDANNTTTLILNNVQLDNIKASDITKQFLDVTVGPDPVNFVSMLTGATVNVKNMVSTSNAPYPCPSSVFAPVGGELIAGPVLKISRRRSMSVRAQVFATKAVPYQTYLTNLKTNPNATLAMLAPTGTVTVYEGSTPIGAADVSGGEFSTIPVGQLSAGTHTLRATYSGDGNYPAMSFGSYMLTVEDTPARPPRPGERQD